MPVDGSSGAFGSQGSLDSVSGAGSGSGTSHGAREAAGSFGSRSVRSLDPDPRFSMPKAAMRPGASKGSGTAILDRSVSGVADPKAAPSIKTAQEHLASRVIEKARQEAAHLKEVVLSTPSSLKHLVKKTKGQDWKVVSEEKLQNLEDKALEAKLRRRNGLINDRSRIKAEVRSQKSLVRQFEKKYGPSLALMEAGATPPEKGKFKMLGGFTVDFGKLEEEERQSALDKLQGSFIKHGKYQEFEEARVTLTDKEKQLASMKENLKELTTELKGDIEQYVPSQKEKVQDRVARQRKTNRQRLAKTRSMLRRERFDKLESLHADINEMKRSISDLQTRRTTISSVEVPRQERVLKKLKRQRKQQFDAFRKESVSLKELKVMMEVVRRHYQKSRAEIQANITALKQERRAIPDDIEKLEGLKADAESELAVQSNDRQLKKDMKELDHLARQMDEQEAKALKREQKAAVRRGTEIGKSIKGR
ncbi:MAG: hypothetical protein ACR2PT_17175 [Endozoicomonas sp.]